MLDNLLSPQIIPPPPPLPKYDPNEDAPKWSAYRYRYFLPAVDKPVPWSPKGTQPDSSDKPDWRGVIRDKVVELPVPEPYKFGAPIDPKYFWFDTPDYADPFKKLGYSLRFFAVSGVTISALKASLQQTEFTLKNNLILLRTVWGPWVLAGMAASAAVISVANLRGKKDDMYNYAAAGVVMATILGRKDHISFFRYIVLCPPLAIFFKYNAEINGGIIPRWNFRSANKFLNANDAEHGITSGDLRLGYRNAASGDPGRGVRTF